MYFIVIMVVTIVQYSWKRLRSKYFANWPKDDGLRNKREFIIVHCSA